MSIWTVTIYKLFNYWSIRKYETNFAKVSCFSSFESHCNYFKLENNIFLYNCNLIPIRSWYFIRYNLLIDAVRSSPMYDDTIVKWSWPWLFALNVSKLINCWSNVNTRNFVIPIAKWDQMFAKLCTENTHFANKYISTIKSRIMSTLYS